VEVKMKKVLLRKSLVIGLIILFVGASFTPVLGDVEKKLKIDNQSRGPSGNMQVGDPQQDGKFVLHINMKHKLPNGNYCTGTWTVTVNILGTDSAMDKANKIREAINNSKAPATGEGAGTGVEVRPRKNSDSVNNLKCSDETKQGQGAETEKTGMSFWGQPPFSMYPLHLGLDQVYDLSVDPSGKTLGEIHAEFVTKLTAAGYNAYLDPFGPAFYIEDINYVEFQSENDEIIPNGILQDDFTTEPFNLLVSGAPAMVGDPGDTVTAVFQITNFRFFADDAHVTITDEHGWAIYPNDIVIPLPEWETMELPVDITIPSKTYVTNEITITVQSLPNPWLSASCAMVVRAGNDAPLAPNINGQINGNVGVEYTYTFEATDPDGDDLYYWILWGDGCPAIEWIGPYESGTLVTQTHTFTTAGTFTISSQAKDEYDEEGAWGTLDVTMPRNKVINQLFPMWILQHFPLVRALFGL
jgi:hypothetical protein